MFHTLNVLAQVAPDWLRTHADPEWVKRYDHRMEDYRLPTSKEERLKVANEIGADGWKLLSRLAQEDAPAWLRDIPTIQTLRWIWEQQFYPVSEGGTFRTTETLCLPGKCTIPLTTWMPPLRKSAMSRGSATKFISPKSATSKHLT